MQIRYFAAKEHSHPTVFTFINELITKQINQRHPSVYVKPPPEQYEKFIFTVP